MYVLPLPLFWSSDNNQITGEGGAGGRVLLEHRDEISVFVVPQPEMKHRDPRGKHGERTERRHARQVVRRETPRPDERAASPDVCLKIHVSILMVVDLPSSTGLDTC